MAATVSNIIFQSRLNNWTPLKRPYYSLLSKCETDAIASKAALFNNRKRHIVFLVFENRHVSLGGLAAVIKVLPQKLAGIGEDVCLVSPFYKNNKNMRSVVESGAITQCCKKQDISMHGKKVAMRVWTDIAGGVRSYYIDIDTFFNAVDHPYDYADSQLLAMDSLAFCCAVPSALQAVGLDSDVILHAHDWETAFAAVTSKIAVAGGNSGVIKTVLTLHNCFDSFVPGRTVSEFVNRDMPPASLLNLSIPLLDGPLTTVSAVFARELLSDPLQTGWFCPHLQKAFSQNPPIGIDNGNFGNRQTAFSSEALSSAEKKDFRQMVLQKKAHRINLEAILEKKDFHEKIGHISCKNSKISVPLFFMSGRMDSGQKGFDVVFRAFSRIKKGSAKLLFCPSNATKQSLAFFADFADRHDGDICILPFRLLGTVYNRVLLGCDFLVMPSIYEPFGAASEAFLSGTPVVARATGGLLSQVKPLNVFHVPDFYGGVVSACGPSERKPTGILFREKYSANDMCAEWSGLMKLRPEDRMQSELYVSIVDAAENAFLEAIGLAIQENAYAEVAYNCICSTEDDGWQDAALAYRKVYDAAVQVNPFDQ